MSGSSVRETPSQSAEEEAPSCRYLWCDAFFEPAYASSGASSSQDPVVPATNGCTFNGHPAGETSWCSTLSAAGCPAIVSGASSSAPEVARLEAALRAAEGQLAETEGRRWLWEQLFSSVAALVVLGPASLEFYKRTLITEVRRALESVEQIREVSNLECSFPAVPSEAPRLRLERWNGDLAGPMEWDVAWSPASWALSLSVSGRQFGLGFTLALRLRRFDLRGRVRVHFPEAKAADLSKINVSFVSLPEIGFAVECGVACGILPLPVQSQVESTVREAFLGWLSKEVVAPHSMLFNVAALEPKRSLSDSDVQQAILDAQLAKGNLDRPRSASAPWSGRPRLP
eukprot:TRINITY_DN38430_c0_g1_i1.p1 TRINITY_DN38430_c0_g1~~TRINITY_DN38430_c0_g1_i1.p1  ORF type:complete len:343 (+),score=69.51 TRINITY_DN38430_c0_g1_i1:110-1138(+)